MTTQLTTLAQQIRFLLGEHADGLSIQMIAQLSHMGGAEDLPNLVNAISDLEARGLIESDSNDVYTLINRRSNELYIDLSGDIETSLEESVQSIKKTLDDYLLEVGDREIIHPLLTARLNAEAALQHYRNKH